MKAKVYYNVFKASFKQELKAFFSCLLEVVSFTLICFIMAQLWLYIFKNGISDIKGFTEGNIVWYFLIGEVVVFGVSGKTLIDDMGALVQSGEIAYKLNKPYNYFIYSIFNTVGQSFVRTLFLVPAAFIIGIFAAGTSVLSVYSIILGLLAVLIAVVLSCIIAAVIGQLAFWTEDAVPFYWIYTKFLIIFGVFFPPELFPHTIAQIIKYSPVYATISGPSLLIAKFDWTTAAQVFITQAVYLVLFAVIGWSLFTRGKRKVSVSGG